MHSWSSRVLDEYPKMAIFFADPPHITLVTQYGQTVDEVRRCDCNLRVGFKSWVGGHIKHIEEKSVYVCVCVLLEGKISESRLSVTAV